eukprot:TRINITY_DN9657_c0_g1_i1.p1 TRINITY_DN9657_c0_g1~~TRINITY_DN9657_c0_g1_i1.p1  ORF type:complete len:461 (-),score=8.82 TRINITY_DN9657_c0_g1_i1:74-1456(-)
MEPRRLSTGDIQRWKLKVILAVYFMVTLLIPLPTWIPFRYSNEVVFFAALVHSTVLSDCKAISKHFWNSSTSANVVLAVAGVFMVTSLVLEGSMSTRLILVSDTVFLVYSGLIPNLVVSMTRVPQLNEVEVSKGLQPKEVKPDGEVKKPACLNSLSIDGIASRKLPTLLVEVKDRYYTALVDTGAQCSIADSNNFDVPDKSNTYSDTIFSPVSKQGQTCPVFSASITIHRFGEPLRLRVSFYFMNFTLSLKSAYHIILGQDILEGLPLLCFRNLISLGDEAASNNLVQLLEDTSESPSKWVKNGTKFHHPFLHFERHSGWISRFILTSSKYQNLEFPLGAFNITLDTKSMEYTCVSDGLYLQFMLPGTKYTNDAQEVIKLLGKDIKMKVFFDGFETSNRLFSYVKCSTKDMTVRLLLSFRFPAIVTEDPVRELLPFRGTPQIGEHPDWARGVGRFKGNLD